MAEFRNNDRFGLDKELFEKENAKRDPAMEKKAQEYIEKLTGKKFAGGFMESLKDGVLLCEAMNAVKPGAIPKINQQKMPFKQMENIANFLKACRTHLGMIESDLFTTADLYDERSAVNVTSGIVAFSRAATKNGYKGPTIAPKESNRVASKRWSLSQSAKKAGVAMTKMMMGSSGVMDKAHIDRSRDITFKANNAGNSANPAEVSRLNMGSKGIMDEKHAAIDRSRNITFGADSANSKYKN